MGVALNISRGLPREVLVDVVDEAEELLAEVEFEEDTLPRARHGRESPELRALLHALADIAKAHPHALAELERVGRHVREVSLEAGLPLFGCHPYLLQVLRLTLEVFFRRQPDLSAFRVHLERSESSGDAPPGLRAEVQWEERRHLLSALRGTLS